jgi:hypothetical protein
MKHFTTEEAIDYVNQLISEKRRGAMRKHLGAGCKRCRETVDLWQKLRNTAALEASFQPPAADVRVAKAAFASAGGRNTSDAREAGS